MAGISKGLVEKIPDGYNWTMDRRVYLKSESELDYVLGLIEQSYNNVIWSGYWLIDSVRRICESDIKIEENPECKHARYAIWN